jgi:hypothetical protein
MQPSCCLVCLQNALCRADPLDVREFPSVPRLQEGPHDPPPSPPRDCPNRRRNSSLIPLPTSYSLEHVCLPYLDRTR